MKLSVIVPVYNVEKFLPRCLDSLLRQGMELGEWEIICVNDGSPDNCAVILAEYEQKHPDIFKIITQENKGLGEARNAGMRLARGTWITFVDSDDYLLDGGYKYLLEHYDRDEVDVVAFEHYHVVTDGIERAYKDAPVEGRILYEGDGAEAYNRYELPFVWTKLYKKSFIQEHKLVFNSIYLEDEFFNMQVFGFNPRLIYTDCRVYAYEINNENSLMHEANKQKVLIQMDGILCGLEYMNALLQKENIAIDLAVKRDISIFVDQFYRKAFRVQLTWKEWKHNIGRLKKMPIHKASYGTTKIYKMVAALKNISGGSYLAYVVISGTYRKFIYRKV